MSKQIKGLVIHTSDSTFGSATLMKTWHMRDNGWDDIGYTVVICNGQVENNTYMEFMDGAIEWGRDIDESGAHARGFNEYESICMIGKDGKFTHKQLYSLRKVIKYFMKNHDLPVSKIYGHGELDKKKAHCPGINVTELLRAIIEDEPLDRFVKGV